MALTDIYNSMGISTEEYTPPTAVELTTEEINDYMDTELSKIDTTLSDVNMAFTALSNMSLSTEDSVPPEIAEVTLQAHAVAAGYPAHISAEEGGVKKAGKAILGAISSAMESASKSFDRVTHWFKGKLGVYNKTLSKLESKLKDIKETKKTVDKTDTIKVKVYDNIVLTLRANGSTPNDSSVLLKYTYTLIGTGVMAAKNLNMVLTGLNQSMGKDNFKVKAKKLQSLTILSAVNIDKNMVFSMGGSVDGVSIAAVSVGRSTLTFIAYKGQDSVIGIRKTKIRSIPNLNARITKYLNKGAIETPVPSIQDIDDMLNNVRFAISEYDKATLSTKASLRLRLEGIVNEGATVRNQKEGPAHLWAAAASSIVEPISLIIDAIDISIKTIRQSVGKYK